MFKVNIIMFACVIHIMGGPLWLYYSRYDKDIDNELHAEVLTFSWNVVVKRGHFWPFFDQVIIFTRDLILVSTS